MAILPFIYGPSRLFLNMQVQEVLGNGLGAFSALEVCNMDMCHSNHLFIYKTKH